MTRGRKVSVLHQYTLGATIIIIFSHPKKNWHDVHLAYPVVLCMFFISTHGILLSPVPGRALILWPVCLVHVSNLRHKRIVGIRICKQRAYRQQHLQTPQLLHHNEMTEYLVKADRPQSTYFTYSTSQPANMMEKPISHTIHLQCPLCQLQMFETVTPVFKKEQT
jgi:hypothetical protein